jgi:hypothetical protein
MVKLAFFARFEAKSGKEEAVAEFLDTALDMAKKEPATIKLVRAQALAHHVRRVRHLQR